MRLFVFVRHAESALNIERRVNGDPDVDVPLTEEGEAQAHRLGLEVANVPFDACIHTRFPRTRLTAELALAGRNIPMTAEPLLDDIDIGELEGVSLEVYRAWKHSHSRSSAFPGGESLDDAASRYVEAFRELLTQPFDNFLIVTHEIPIRYALNGAMGSDSLDGPAHEVANAVPYLFDEDSLGRAANRIEEILAGTLSA
ncbi:MAG: histidine phosphatase family protein [Gaiellaceae bacterium]